MKMKKTNLALMCMAAVAMLTACGGGNSTKQSSDDTLDAQELAEKVANAPARSRIAAEYFIKNNGGLDPADLLPDWNYIIEPESNSFYGDTGIGTMCFYSPDGEELTKEAYTAWVRKLYDASKKISDDGFNIEGFEGSSDPAIALGEKSLEDMIAKGESGIIYLGMYSWGYRYNGKMMRIWTEREERNGKYWAKIDVANALTKSFDETMQDAEKALEREDVQQAVKDALK